MERIVEARIEIPMGSQNKYEVNQKTGKIVLDRVLYSASFYPAEYGFIEGTLGDDGDPLDILVFTTYPTFPGCYIKARIIGGMDMIDTGEGDKKILAVNVGDPRYDYIKTLDDLSPHYLKEIDNFFSNYKALQHKETSVEGWLTIDESIKILEESIENYKKENN
jgi:inorganic pyrophosphatase